MNIQRERFSDIFMELPELWRAHYEEIANDKDKVPLSPDIFSYLNYEQNNRLVIFTARDEGKLVGYAFFILQFSLHYKELSMAANDLFYVRPEYRGRFIGGQLIDAAEKEFRQMGIRLIQMRTKTKHNFGRIPERKGFKETEVVYRKYIGD